MKTRDLNAAGFYLLSIFEKCVSGDFRVIAHDGPRVDSAGKDVAQFQDAFFDPRLAVLERLLGVFVFAAQPGSANAAVDAVKSACLSGIYKLAAGLGHSASFYKNAVVFSWRFARSGVG